MKLILSFLSLAYLILFFSCTKETTTEEDNTSNISEIPTIEEFIITPNVVKALEDSLTFAITYTDGNGDLGFSHPDSTSLLITDLRNGIVERFHIGAITPQNFDKPVRGTLELKVPFVLIFNNNNQSETAKFSAQILDRANNKSLPKESNTITINP